MQKKEEDKYKVSVVTAVYNVEQYLEEMADSIITQTIGFENIQFILVDDGSLDASGEICDRYASEYPDNVVVVHKENGGVSSARNEGLKYVEGEYVNFTDADDKLKADALEKMYNYLKANENWIDLVAIRVHFFGSRGGEHLLNYRFKKTRIVDLRQDYNCIQLAINCTLIKKECFQDRYFDTGLSYAEDARLVTEILLDKMRYGLLRGTCYFYRKRETEDSALDLGRNKAGYYIPYMERFILFSLENAEKRKGYIPQFVQYMCMEDLQWRLNKNPLVQTGVLDGQEENTYKNLIVKALQYIDNKIILEQRNIGNNYKIALLLLKDENKGKEELVACPDDLKICIGDISSAYAGSYSMFFEFYNITVQEVVMEGHIRCFANLRDVEVILKTCGEENTPAEYIAELCEREEKCTSCMDEVITQAKGFKFTINLNELHDETILKLYLRYQGHDIECRKIWFGKFFPLSNKMRSSYVYQGGCILTYSGNKLVLLKNADKKAVRKNEKTFQKELLYKKDRAVFRGWIARNMYLFLRRFKKKEIWLISDRLTKADDNGEAFFQYLNEKHKNEGIEFYFVLDKESADYDRVKKIGKVVPYHSNTYKILSLLCDKVISSQGDDYVFNRFFDRAYIYKDIIIWKPFVFLQHGIIQNDLSGWLTRANKNISLFVTTTYMEYQSILDGAYYYDEKQVKCTGMPRYDYLYDESENRRTITFMPTWRTYLAGVHDVQKDSRVLIKGFEESTYCRMYRQVFSNAGLFEAADRYHYKIRLMLHPVMPRECIRYFECNDAMEVLDANTRYRDLFADSKLIVTDYSSTVFDFAYLRKTVLYYQQDKEEFFSGKHTVNKGYFDYERDGFGEVEYTAEDLVNRIIEYMENDCQLKEKYRERIDRTFSYHDKNNCDRVYQEIRNL